MGKHGIQRSSSFRGGMFSHIHRTITLGAAIWVVIVALQGSGTFYLHM